jgi:YfiH family protein
MNLTHYIKPNWPAPINVSAYVTTRTGGHSNAPYNSFNLADHVGDNLIDVLANRKQLYDELNLPNEPIWLKQIHGNNVTCANEMKINIEADAAYATSPNIICVVLTADCLPILLCDRLGTKVAAVHAGWRSLSDGIIEKTITALNTPSSQLLVWLGPAISQQFYEVGIEVYDKFVQHSKDAKTAFKKKNKSKWLADIYILAKQRLASCNITNIYSNRFCTFTDEQRFFSRLRA